ncbi:hypothetical protein ACWPKO_29900 (plasmid) [Coraliomargarita sp. W4R53]
MIGKSVALVTISLFILPVSACSAQPATLSECLNRVAEHVRIDATDLQVVETFESPGGSLDWRGKFEGGEWACGGDDDQL